jgi:type IV pilus assembly protein PilX
MSRPSNTPSHSHVSARQQGAALITGLIFLVVLTMIGITAARISTLEERMSGNMRDRSLAMQAAEMALRDAEQDILGLGTRSPSIEGIQFFGSDCNANTIIGDYDDGLCDRRGDLPTYTNTSINFPQFIATTTGVTHNAFSLDMTEEAAEDDDMPSVAYGFFTGAEEIPLVAEQPRYVITGMQKQKAGDGSDVFYYRITVRAVGANPNTVVWLQEVFKR